MTECDSTGVCQTASDSPSLSLSKSGDFLGHWLPSHLWLQERDSRSEVDNMRAERCELGFFEVAALTIHEHEDSGTLPRSHYERVDRRRCNRERPNLARDANCRFFDRASTANRYGRDRSAES